jgi:hypothetical protein
MSEANGPEHAGLASWRAKWCWTRKYLSRPWNSYALFRKSVELKDRARRAVVRVSADARYTLYVNARRVHFGPARSYQHCQSFDTLDITSLLEVGANAICVVAHQFGVPTFQSIYRDVAGFLLDAEIESDGAAVALHTPDGWLCRPSSAWRRDVVRKTIQLGFQEHYDAAADPPGWMLPAYQPNDEDGWKAPHVIGPAGTWPWLAMEPRGVPLLADHVEDFHAVLSQFRGENARGYKVVDDVYHLPLAEKRKPDRELIEVPDAMLRDHESLTTIHPPDDGEFVMAVLDLGQYRTGHTLIDIADAAGDEIIDFIYSEALDKSEFPLILPPTTGCEEATADRYRCRPGAQKWETYHFNGMRYCTVVFRNVTKPLKVRHIALRQVYAAVENVGAFECSDGLLTKVWHVGRETQRNCLFDAFVDCPWREQAMWWGDARVQAKVTAFAFGDTSVLERGIRLVGRSQGPDGSLHSHPPADVPGHRLIDFMLTWVASLWDCYFYTGRGEVLAERLPVVSRLFDFFEKHESKDHLIGGFEGWWVFLDWQPLFKGDHGALLNLMYLKGLRDASRIARVVGDASVKRYDERAALVEQAIESQFWDDKTKNFRDGHDISTDKPVEQVSQHANALAILLDLKPEHHQRIARDVLLKPAKSKRSKVITGSPFFYAYILEAMLKAGLVSEAVEIIREKWGTEMIERGGATTFWEMWDVTIQSRCHAWSASPVYHLGELVLGVHQLEAGWRKARIAPHCGELDYARGTVPTPLGLIRVEWEKVSEDQLAVSIEVPEGMDASFVAPSGESRTLDAGSNEFHT